MNCLTRGATTPARTIARNLMTAAALSALIGTGADATRFLDDAQARSSSPPDQRVTRGATVVPNTYNADQHTVELVLSTGARVRRYGYFEEILMDAAAADLSRVASGNVKILNSHNAWDIKAILGTLLNARFENGQLVGVMKFGETPNAVEAEGMVARGELTGISIGYQVALWRAVEIIVDPASGVEITVWRADEWTLLEASYVSVPADPNAGVRSAVSSQPGNPSAETRGTQEEQDMLTRNAPAVVPPANPNPASPAAPVARAAEPAAPAAPAAAEPVLAASVSRFNGPDALAFVALGRDMGVEARASELVAQNGRGEVGVDTCRSELLRAAAERQAANVSHVRNGGIVVVDDARDKWMRGAGNSIIQRAGLTDILSRAAQMRGEKIDLDPGEFRGIRNVELARMSLENMGVRIDTYNRERIIELGFTSTRGGAQSSSDFAVLLESVMHKVLQAAYIITPDTWSRFCGKGSVVDFRPHPRYLRGTFGTLDSLTENGEFKNKPIPDGAKESISAKTKGNIVALTRRAMVNDDLGAFNNITLDLGRAAKLSIEVDVYALLALASGAGPTMNDGKAMFHDDHKNIATTAAVPSVAAFDAIRVLMAQQKDVSGNEFIDVRPAVWLGPVTFGGLARVVNGAQYDPDTASKLQRPNIVNGLFKDVIDTPRLAGTRWYAFADPVTHPAIEVVFLDGVQEPKLEQQDGWRSDGSEWKVVLDYGVGGTNWRAAATNAGAAN